MSGKLPLTSPFERRDSVSNQGLPESGRQRQRADCATDVTARPTYISLKISDIKIKSLYFYFNLKTRESWIASVLEEKNN